MTDLEKAALDGERQRATEANLKIAQMELDRKWLDSLLAKYRDANILMENQLLMLKGRGWWARLIRRGE